MESFYPVRDEYGESTQRERGVGVWKEQEPQWERGKVGKKPG